MLGTMVAHVAVIREVKSTNFVRSTNGNIWSVLTI